MHHVVLLVSVQLFHFTLIFTYILYYSSDIYLQLYYLFSVSLRDIGEIKNIYIFIIKTIQWITN